MLFGGLGNDEIFGEDGNDTLLGDAGDDTFNFSAGSDVIVGGEGLDTMQFVGTIPVSVDLARGTATNGAGDTTTFSEIENAAGGKSSDSILGNNFRNALSGNLGADLIQGLGGQDTIEGGQGADTLYGGTGDDYFVFSVDTSSASADDIVDFRSSDDSIHLVSAGNDQSLGQLEDASFLANSTGLASGIEDRVIFNTISGQVFYDCDGSGEKPAIELFSLNPSVDVTAADFTFF